LASRRPLPSASIHTKRPQIERTFVGAGVRDVGDFANERRRRNPSPRNIRQSLRHGRRILCLYAYRYSSRARKCADWCCQHAWNTTPQTRARGASAASLLVGQYELLVGTGFTLASRPRFSVADNARPNSASRATPNVLVGVASLVCLVSDQRRERRKYASLYLAEIYRTEMGPQQIQRHNEIALSAASTLTFPIDR